MAWEWSHTPEAYEYVHEQLMELDRDVLHDYVTEWRAWDGNTSNPQLDMERWDKSVEEADAMTQEEMVEFVWTRTREQSTCTDGGWFAWCCPFGCDPHQQPFSSDEDDGCHPCELQSIVKR